MRYGPHESTGGGTLQTTAYRTTSSSFTMSTAGQKRPRVPAYSKAHRAGGLMRIRLWRKGWDSNPRSGFPDSGLANRFGPSVAVFWGITRDANPALKPVHVSSRLTTSERSAVKIAVT